MRRELSRTHTDYIERKQSCSNADFYLQEYADETEQEQLSNLFSKPEKWRGKLTLASIRKNRNGVNKLLQPKVGHQKVKYLWRIPDVELSKKPRTSELTKL